MQNSFISLKNISEERILTTLDVAETMLTLVKRDNKKAPHLLGKNVILMFLSDNRKMRLSFELASQFLSANVADLTGNIARTESGYTNVVELGKIIEQMGADFIVIKHDDEGSAKYLAENSKAMIINAGDGRNERPTKALLDLMTIKRHKGGFRGLKVAFIGDIFNAPAAKSNMYALKTLGAEITVSGPPTLVPSGLEQLGFKVYKNPRDAVKNADVIMSQSLTTNSIYGNKFPSENEYKGLFKVTKELVSCAKKDAIILHPGKSDRSIEISSEILTSSRTIIEEQMTYSVAVPMAILYMLSMKGGEK